MIVRSLPAGRSFKWLATYLTHDPKAETADRVLFTHTLNLAFDDVGSAVDTMLRTYWARDILKKEAGVRPGGSSVEKPVKHVSLAWHPSEQPTQEVMIAAADSYLRKMGWEAHQCLIVGHFEPGKHRHIHLMLNVIHPERGTRLDDRFERRRAQEWALAYEREHGKVYCEQRLKPVAERQASPPRNVWHEVRVLRPEPGPEGKRQTEIDYDVPAHLWRRQEWTVLKERQKDERLSFFEDLVGSYRVYRAKLYNTTSVRFRPEWRNYYQIKRAGVSAEALKGFKNDLITRQKEEYRKAVREASPRLKEEKDRAYKELLARQKAERAGLVDRQEVGQPSLELARYGAPRPIRPLRFAAPASHPSAPQTSSDRPFVWSMKAGMVAQQRSADRWLERALDRINRDSKGAAQSPPIRNRLAEARQRPTTDKKGKEKDGAKIGIEPDGPGGSGM